jgi:hypothetical protein
MAENLEQVGVNGDGSTSNFADNTLKVARGHQVCSLLQARRFRECHERMARVTEFTAEAQSLEEDESEEGSDGRGRLTPTLKNASIRGAKPRSRSC